jgi:hypothetical protein
MNHELALAWAQASAKARGCVCAVEITLTDEGVVTRARIAHDAGCPALTASTHRRRRPHRYSR